MAEGEERARRLAPRLAREDFGSVFASPLVRAVQTARLAGFHSPTLEALLTEWDYGEYEGVTSAEIRRARPGWDLWRDGCPGGETIAQVRQRAATFIDEVIAGGQERVIAFSHGHLLRVLAVVFLDLPDRAAAGLNLDTASISVLRTAGKSRLVQLWNDTGHLPGKPS